MLRPEILRYYQRGGERTRLAAGTGRLEFLRTWDVLTRVLPPAPADLLDVGGATGVYAGPLAAAGYRVRLVDPVPEHVSAAGALPGVTAVAGDARALPAAGGSVDGVLLLGPLYHLLERTDRVTAWREAARVVRPGGVVVGATISRFAALFDGFTRAFGEDEEFRPVVTDILADGVLDAADWERSLFTTAYFHRPEEVPGEATEAGLTGVRQIGVEGLVWTMGPALAYILDSPQRTDTVLAQLRRVEEEPSLLGASAHVLTVARAA